ncbi:hypothetical protein LEP1GSC103_0447 [Leptospira borgpetersenii serovar Javanica str. UI 09931]|uniref:Uncharacterized protein n=6 Tax=Leptospira borgpetersenii TaxID=174 RepID=M3H4W3_LEPBO|nr:hypothetical protein LBBP_03147 [Leptospira borgpetersenii serovar Ballum]EKP14389.1 hypothetical protein LEP1GSC128_1500 [Leptospira borgpetersenii str. 200801926]EKQ92722.1 hypothetical protein LEP1GSC101_2853 [Leptospira borgpetersenii str. UI 09149]EKQ99872.1 hypothetical protein LEP1GSC121_2148 [Leptospira borgpetersenii serovar Castellonis str. 200801910]EMG02119.1 hypothetical protein LEP1GSC123_2719 [Leptospira borgpetersenii str. 200701203]EMK12367.1 hypothetical protein LEP1GSC066
MISYPMFFPLFDTIPGGVSAIDSTIKRIDLINLNIQNLFFNFVSRSED